MEISKFNYDLAISNIGILCDFYYGNAKQCSHMDSFGYDDAKAKIIQMADHIKDGTAICYGLFDEGVLVGYIWAYSHKYRDEDRVYISEIRILEKYRGNGYGEELIRQVENEARRLKVAAVYLHAEAVNEAAIRFYKKLGFIPERIQFRKEIRNGEGA